MDNILKYNIKDLRYKFSISVVTIAQKCNVTEKTVRDWENIPQNSTKSIPSDQLNIISNLFDMYMEDIYTQSSKKEISC